MVALLELLAPASFVETKAVPAVLFSAPKTAITTSRLL